MIFRTERATRDGERGAVLVLCALVLSALIAFTSLAVDLGFQRMARRDMQAIADVVALDLVRRIDGSTAAALTPIMDVARDESVARNTGTVGEAPTVTYRLGTIDGNHDFQPVAPSGTPTAVEVTATTTVDYWFRPGTGAASRRAVASRGASACFSLGSFAAGLTPQANTLLGQLLGGMFGLHPPALQVLGYNGLVSADISLALLAADLGLATPSEVLTTDVTLGQLYVAIARVLTQTNPGHVGIGALNQIINANAAILSRPITLGELLDVRPGAEGAAMQATFNLLDLVAGGAFLADSDHAISLSGLGINIAGLISSSTTVSIVEALRPVCLSLGQTARTDQIRLDVDLRVQVLILQVLAIQVHLRTATATATLTDVQCSADQTQHTAHIQTSTGLASLHADAGLLGIPLPILRAGFNGQVQPPLRFDIPPPLPQSRNFGEGDASLSQANLSLLSLVLSPIVGPILASLQTGLLQPLLDMLGLDVAGGTVILRSVSCRPALLVA